MRLFSSGVERAPRRLDRPPTHIGAARRQRGASTLEYIVLVAVLVLGLVGAWRYFAGQASDGLAVEADDLHAVALGRPIDRPITPAEGVDPGPSGAEQGDDGRSDDAPVDQRQQGLDADQQPGDGQPGQQRPSPPGPGKPGDGGGGGGSGAGDGTDEPGRLGLGHRKWDRHRVPDGKGGSKWSDEKADPWKQYGKDEAFDAVDGFSPDFEVGIQTSTKPIEGSVWSFGEKGNRLQFVGGEFKAGAGVGWDPKTNTGRIGVNVNAEAYGARYEGELSGALDVGEVTFEGKASGKAYVGKVNADLDVGIIKNKDKTIVGAKGGVGASVFSAEGTVEGKISLMDAIELGTGNTGIGMLDRALANPVTGWLGRKLVGAIKQSKTVSGFLERTKVGVQCTGSVSAISAEAEAVAAYVNDKKKRRAGLQLGAKLGFGAGAGLKCSAFVEY